MLIDTVKSAVLIGREVAKQGKVADYIPELSKADKNHLGLCVYTCDGQMVESGDTEQRFTIQSVCKVVNLAVALQAFGFDEVFSHVKMEPSGDAFDSVIKLDLASNRPYMAHISHVHVGYIERGERAPSLDVLISIANTLNVSSDDLLADNLLVSSTGISSSEIEILEDCSAEEAEILLQVMRRLKEIIRNYRISR